MVQPDDDSRPRRPADSAQVLVLAPAGRDAVMALELLRRAQIDARAVGSLAELAAAVDEAPGALLLTSEALQGVEPTPLREALERQPPWSDLPIIWLEPARTGTRQPRTTASVVLPFANAIQLERPLSSNSLISAVVSALRARARQFQLRDRFEQLEQQAEVLKESRQALQDSEAKFRSITDSVDTMLWTSRPDGDTDFFNARWYEFSGMARGSAEGQGWSELLHPEDEARTWEVWGRSLATGDDYCIEYRLRHCSGQYRWVLGRAQPQRDDRGRIVRWFGSCTDIHDLVEARELLARSREQLEQDVRLRTQERDQIWQASGDLFGVADADGVWLAVNPAWQQVLGWPAEAIVGRTTDWLTHPDDLARTRREIEEDLAAGHITTAFENRFRHQDGSYRTLSWTAVPRGDRLYCVARDVTAQLQQEQALLATEAQLRQAQKMEAVGQLTGGIAHDFNNFLQGITGSLAIVRKRLQKGQLDDVDRYIDSANRSARQAASLTHRLLAFSRRQPLAPTRVDINTLVQSMEGLMSRTLGEGISLQLQLGAELPQVLCDANQLESALLNLTINARDAMPHGGELVVTTSVTTGRDWPEAIHPNRTLVAVAVRDTGTGMTADVVARAFDPFFTTKPLGQGTGLGLSMVYGFAHQSEGLCRIDSQPGRGTTVSVALPLAPADAEDALAPESAAPPASLRARAKVLVVEDDEVVRQLVTDALRELGLQVLPAADGIAALELLRRELPIDLLVSDVGLPGLNGRQLAEAARELQPGLRVLLMTGYIHEVAGAQNFLEPGMALLTKPFEMDAFARSVGELLDGAGVAQGVAR